MTRHSPSLAGRGRPAPTAGEPTPVPRALGILELLSRHVIRGLRQCDIIETTGWKRSNVSRDLQLLEQCGEVRCDEQGYYKLTPTWLARAVRFQQQMDSAQRELQETAFNVLSRARQ